MDLAGCGGLPWAFSPAVARSSCGLSGRRPWSGWAASLALGAGPSACGELVVTQASSKLLRPRELRRTVLSLGTQVPLTLQPLPRGQGPLPQPGRPPGTCAPLPLALVPEPHPHPLGETRALGGASAGHQPLRLSQGVPVPICPLLGTPCVWVVLSVESTRVVTTGTWKPLAVCGSRCCCHSVQTRGWPLLLYEALVLVTYVCFLFFSFLPASLPSFLLKNALS